MPGEKRNYPRIKTDSAAKINLHMPAQLSDVSEGGAGVSAIEEIASPAIILEIDFPAIEPAFKAQAKLVWKRGFGGEGFVYGFEFIDLSEAQKALIRKQIIRQQLNNLLEDVRLTEARKLIENFFLKDMLECMEGIIKLNSLIAKQEGYSEELAARFEQINNQIVLKGYCLDELLSHAEVSKKIRVHFRQLFGAWAYKSPIVHHALLKPRGYAGDYKLLELIYENNPVFCATIGYYYDRYFLKSPHAVGLRMRKDRLRDMLARFIAAAKQEKMNILAIGCGPCREIRELLPQLNSNAQALFSCLDWDEEALFFSERQLLPLKPRNVDFKFIKEDLVNLMSLESKKQATGGQHIIYSIGLADYLPNEELKALMVSLYALLHTQGKLILTHKNRDKTFSSIPPDWFCDWKFVSRNRDEVIKLIHEIEIPKFSLSIETDDFGYINYFILTKL